MTEGMSDRVWQVSKDILARYQDDVINANTASRHEITNSFYVGRGTIWGNPYRIGAHGTRDEVVRAFVERWFHLDAATRNRRIRPVAEALRQGRKLRCFCAPQLCHAQVLAWYARNVYDRTIP